MKKIMKWVACLSAAFALTACGTNTESPSEETNSSSNKVNIYTTVYPLQYFSERIGGDLVTVDTVYPPGADEHTFEPSQKDMMKLADSDLFFYIGLGLEGFVEKATDTLKNEHVTMIPVGESIHFEEETDAEASTDSHSHEEDTSSSEDGHDHGDIDPHVWLDPLYSIDMAEAIKDELVKKLPDHKDELENNFAQLQADLQSLNTEFAEAVNGAAHKEFLVSHAAFGYWEARYGLEQISISGLTSSNEPSQKELETIIQTAEEHDIHYVFFEQNVSSKLTEIVQKEIGAESLVLHNLSVLNDDDINNDRNYLTIMKDNIAALKKSLQ